MKTYKIIIRKANGDVVYNEPFDAKNTKGAYQQAFKMRDALALSPIQKENVSITISEKKH